MSSQPPVPTSWSRPRWVWTVLLVWSAQGSLLWMLSDTTPAFTRPTHSGPRVELIAGTAADLPLQESLAVADPALYALASRRGFSGPVWWDLLRPQLHLPDWEEPDRWWQPRLETVGATFLGFVRTNAPVAMTVAEKPPAEPADIPVSSNLMAAQSTLEIQGDLAARRLRSPLKLPSWTDTDFLKNTVVQVAVDPAGVPSCVVLLERSRLKAAEADQRALDLAREARFEPLTAGEPASMVAEGPRTWGTMIFHWHVEPPPAAGNAVPPP